MGKQSDILDFDSYKKLVDWPDKHLQTDLSEEELKRIYDVYVSTQQQLHKKFNKIKIF